MHSIIRRATVAAVCAGALTAAGCLDTTGSTDVQLLPTHHAVVYGTVRFADGRPVVGATVTPTVAQICPCYAVSIYVREGGGPTSPSGDYRILYEAALPRSVNATVAVQLEVQPPAGAGALTVTTLPRPALLGDPLDSSRVDVVIH